MAAPRSHMCYRVVRNILGQFRLHKGIKSAQTTRCLSSSSRTYNGNQDGEAITSRDPGPVYLDERVQQLLYKVTGFNIDKIFQRRAETELEPPQYKLLTDKQLAEEQELAIQRAQWRLQMPPVLKPRDPKVEVISDDKDVAGHDTVKYVFTDITYGLEDQDRTMVVREPDGVLRTASPEERDRLQLVYLPPEGRMHRTPQMFQPEHLERMLGEGRYEYILDRACVQFEPNDPQFIGVTQRVYEHIDAAGEYEVLYSTRHYGGMTFYFTFYQKLDGLLLHKVTQHEIHLAADLVRLYHIVHPDCASATTPQPTDDLELIQLYADHVSRRKAELDLAIQSYKANVPRAARAT